MYITQYPKFYNSFIIGLAHYANHYTSLLVFLAHYTKVWKGGPAPPSTVVRNGRVIDVFLRGINILLHQFW